MLNEIMEKATKLYIEAVGVELEGGWNEYIADMVRDRSVRVPARYIGEVNSPPFTSGDEIRKWLQRYYPDKVNSTCGFHIHVSLKNMLYYSLLMDKVFKSYFNTSLIRFRDKLWLQYARSSDPRTYYNLRQLYERMSNRVKWCKNKWYPYIQSLLDDKDTIRYTRLNFAWNRHRTIECRVFPMFDGEEKIALSMTAIGFYIETITDYLSQRLKKRNRANHLKVVINPMYYQAKETKEV